MKEDQHARHCTARRGNDIVHASIYRLSPASRHAGSAACHVQWNALTTLKVVGWDEMGRDEMERDGMGWDGDGMETGLD